MIEKYGSVPLVLFSMDGFLGGLIVYFLIKI